MPLTRGQRILKTVAVFVLIFILPMIVGMFVSYQSLPGLLAPFLLVTVTALLYKNEGTGLQELGLIKPISQVKLLPAGILLGVSLIGTVVLVQKLYLNFTLTWNASANYEMIFMGLLIFLPGVLNEELIFRGYSYKHTFTMIGSQKANIIFGGLFMVWHWISWNAWGNYAVMLGSFTTAIGHLLFATAFLRSGSLYLAIGLHLGINWAQKNIFLVTDSITAETSPDAIFIIDTSKTEPTYWTNTLNTILPILIFLGLYWLLKRLYKFNR